MKLRIRRLFKRMVQKKVPGFSLVEVAIALIVIGLLMGATFKGRDLIESARLNALVMQINTLTVAIRTFQEQYNAPPGDLSAANIYFDEAPAGDGDGVIGGQGLDANADAGKVWQQLGAAGLIPHCGTPTGTRLQAGKGAPGPKIGGVITLEQDPEGDLSGRWMVVGMPQGNRAVGALLTPKQARQILEKFSEREPLRGDVQVRDGEALPAGVTCLVGEKLNLKESRRACVLYVRVD